MSLNGKQRGAVQEGFLADTGKRAVKVDVSGTDTNPRLRRNLSRIGCTVPDESDWGMAMDSLHLVIYTAVALAPPQILRRAGPTPAEHPLPNRGARST